MSFVRVPHRSHSLSSLNSSRARRKRRKPQAAWDDSVTDLSQHRATNEEIEHRRSVHKSKNLDAVRQQKLEKQIAKARANKEPAHDTSDYRGTRLLREILYDESQLQDALSHSDRVMAVVQDLFGDDPKRHTAFPNVTLAPGQKPSHRHQGPILEAPETPSRLTILSESVMNSQALNHMEDNGSSESDLEEDKENLPVSFHGNLNFDRFQDFIKKQQKKQATHPYDSTHASILQSAGNLRFQQEGKQQIKEMYCESLDSSQADGDSVPSTNAINDTVKVKKKTRSRIGKEKQKKEEEEKQTEDAMNLSTVLKGLAQQMTDYEVATGRQAQGDTSLSTNVHVPGVSGYTSLLVQTIAKLIGYLKETETRMLEEKQTREQMQYQMAEQRILIDAITADLLATQDLQLQNQQEFNQYMGHTQAQLTSIQEMLSKLGLQEPSGSQPGATQHQSSQQTQPLSSQQRITKPDRVHQPMASRPHLTQQLPPHKGVHQPVSSQPLQPHLTQPLPLEGVHQPVSSQPSQPHCTQSLPSQQFVPHSGIPTQGTLQTVSSQLYPHSSRPAPSQQLGPHSRMSQHGGQVHVPQASQERQSHQQRYHEQHQSADVRADQLATKPLVTHLPVTTNSTTSLEAELSIALQTAMSKTGTSSDPTATSTRLQRHYRETFPNKSTQSRLPHTRQDVDLTEAPTATSAMLQRHYGETFPNKSTQSRLPHTRQDVDLSEALPDDTLTSQFTSSFLEDKRHLGTRDTRIPFQPAILLSPPRQRDRSAVLRPKLASVGAYPMSTSDGTAIGTIHSIQRVAETHTTPSSLSQSLYPSKLIPAVPISRSSEQQQISPMENTNFPVSVQTDADLAARIAQLTKQHEEAQSRLSQLKSTSGGTGGGKMEAASSRMVETSNSNCKLPGAALPVSPPISPIPFDPQPMKTVNNKANEGRTIHISLPRHDDLEMSATSTPSPKTIDGRTRTRQINLHQSQSSQPWKTPDKHVQGDSQEDQFFALTAHMST